MRKTCLFGTFLLFATAALPQVDTGTIAGTVRDSQGAAVGAATMTFLDLATGTTTRTQTDAAGEYASPPLRPSQYKVTTKATGFKTESHSGISLRVQDRLRLDVTMSVGSVSETVEVTSDAPIIQ